MIGLAYEMQILKSNELKEYIKKSLKNISNSFVTLGFIKTADMGLFDKLFKKDKSDFEANTPLEILEEELYGFLRYEATHRAQGVRLPHFHEKSNPATLGSILNITTRFWIPDIISMSCISTGELGKDLEVRHETDPSTILNTKQQC